MASLTAAYEVSRSFHRYLASAKQAYRKLDKESERLEATFARVEASFWRIYNEQFRKFHEKEGRVAPPSPPPAPKGGPKRGRKPRAKSPTIKASPPRADPAPRPAAKGRGRKKKKDTKAQTAKRGDGDEPRREGGPPRPLPPPPVGHGPAWRDWKDLAPDMEFIAALSERYLWAQESKRHIVSQIVQRQKKTRQALLVLKQYMQEGLEGKPRPVRFEKIRKVVDAILDNSCSCGTSCNTSDDVVECAGEGCSIRFFHRSCAHRLSYYGQDGDEWMSSGEEAESEETDSDSDSEDSDELDVAVPPMPVPSPWPFSGQTGAGTAPAPAPAPEGEAEGGATAGQRGAEGGSQREGEGEGEMGWMCPCCLARLERDEDPRSPTPPALRDPAHPFPPETTARRRLRRRPPPPQPVPPEVPPTPPPASFSPPPVSGDRSRGESGSDYSRDQGGYNRDGQGRGYWEEDQEEWYDEEEIYWDEGCTLQEWGGEWFRGYDGPHTQPPAPAPPPPPPKKKFGFGKIGTVKQPKAPEEPAPKPKKFGFGKISTAKPKPPEEPKPQPEEPKPTPPETSEEPVAAAKADTPDKEAPKDGEGTKGPEKPFVFPQQIRGGRKEESEDFFAPWREAQGLTEESARLGRNWECQGMPWSELWPVGKSWAEPPAAGSDNEGEGYEGEGEDYRESWQKGTSSSDSESCGSDEMYWGMDKTEELEVLQSEWEAFLRDLGRGKPGRKAEASFRPDGAYDDTESEDIDWQMPETVARDYRKPRLPRTLLPTPQKPVRFF